MFLARKKSENSDLTKEQNKIARGSVFKGDIESQGNFRIEGKLIGNLKTLGKVVVSKTGYIEGRVQCDNADIEGICKGELEVKKQLNLKVSSKIEGEVNAGKLIIEPGAILNANCSTKQTVKPLLSNVKKEQSA